MGHLWQGYVRTSFSNARSIGSFDGSQSSVSRSSLRRSCSSSTEIAAAGAELGGGGAAAPPGANRRRNPGRKQGGSHPPLTRPAEPHPIGPLPRRRSRCGAGAERGRCGAALDPRRLTVRRQPNGQERLSAAVSRRVRCGADAVRFAVDAVCCGALGCRVEETLLSVTVGGDSRVLCPDCAAEFVRRRSQ